MKLKRTICLALVAACALLWGCGDGAKDKYYEYDYEPVHQSDSRKLAFYSSDADVDYVLNDYFERHMRYDENTQIHDFPVGEGRSDWKEWEAITGSFWDSSAAYGTLPARYATKDIVTKWLREPNIDSQGYVMPDNGKDGSWGLGWEFPSHKELSGLYYDFPKSTQGWTVADNCGAYISAGETELVASAAGLSKVSLETPQIGKTAVGMPFVEIKFKVNVSDKTAIDDLYLYYKTRDNDTYSEYRKVAFSTFCLQGFSLAYGGSETYSTGFFPMYLLEDWGKETNEITGLKVVLAAKEGKTLSGTFTMDWFGGEYDDRHIINNCNYIIAAKEMLAFSQDKELLETVIPNARRAMNFLYYQLKGKEGLISTEYLVGHDNRMTMLNYGLGDGYWDVSSFPDVNMYCNISYFNAIKAMEYLEGMCTLYGVGKTETFTQNDDFTGRYRYSLNEDSLAALKEQCRESFQTYFWNEDTGRFHAGIRSDNNSKQDNGYVMFNQQAIVAGLATAEQQASIMSWINGARTVKFDQSTGADIYNFRFAPRFCTSELAPDVYWSGIGSFGTNVNNGGSALHLAYYDLVSQAMTDANGAGKRLNEFVKWYKDVAAAGGQGWNFYRDYYSSTGITLQGGGSGGQIGLDYEFLEASIYIRAIPDAFFGLDPIAGNTLSVTPNLPDSLHFMRMENLTYAGRYYDLSVGHYFAAVSGVANYGAPVAGAKLQFVFDIPDFEYRVYADGAQTEDYAIRDGKLVVTADFGNTKIEIKKV